MPGHTAIIQSINNKQSTRSFVDVNNPNSVQPIINQPNIANHSLKAQDIASPMNIDELSANQPNNQSVNAPIQTHQSNGTHATVINPAVINSNASSPPPAKFAFNAISPRKLVDAGIDPDNPNSLYVKFSLWINHPVRLSSMPKGQWTIEDTITMLSSSTMGLGIKMPPVPKSMVLGGMNNRNVDSDELVMEFIEARKAELSRLSCVAAQEWDDKSAAELFQLMVEWDKSVNKLYKPTEFVEGWRGLLIADDSRITNVKKSTNSTSVSMNLQFPNSNVCALVALHLLAWSCIVQLFPEPVFSVQQILRSSNEPVSDWSNSGTRAKDRKNTMRRSSSNVQNIKARLSTIDQLDSLKSAKCFTNYPSTALALSFSSIQQTSAKWMSLMIDGIPWQSYHNSIHCMLSDLTWRAWVTSNAANAKIRTTEARPAPRVALWIPMCDSNKIAELSQSLRALWPRSCLVASVKQNINRSQQRSAITAKPIKFSEHNVAVLNASNITSNNRLTSWSAAKSFASAVTATLMPAVYSSPRPARPAAPTERSEIAALHNQVADLQRQLAAVQAMLSTSNASNHHAHPAPSSLLQIPAQIPTMPNNNRVVKTSSTKRKRSELLTQSLPNQVIQAPLPNEQRINSVPPAPKARAPIAPSANARTDQHQPSSETEPQSVVALRAEIAEVRASQSAISNSLASIYAVMHRLAQMIDPSAPPPTAPAETHLVNQPSAQPERLKQH